MMVNQALPDRFWRKVDKSSPYGTVRNIVDGYQWKEVVL